MSDNSRSSTLERILTIFGLLLRADPVALIQELYQVVSPFLSRNPGMYEVLEYDVRLELKDTKGETAVYYKRQKVKFLQDNVIAYQDKGWGDGDTFSDYKCSPGVVVDRYREGHRYQILISLRQTKMRGDIEEFLIERTIKNGFLQHIEEVQTEINHKTQKVSVSVIFPHKRPPTQVELVEQHSTRTTALGADYMRLLPDGRRQVTWTKERPKLFEAYILRWSW